MTIEIKQLVIRAVADGRAPKSAPSSIGETSETPEPRRMISAEPPRAAEVADDRQALVASVVREVLRKLERARER